MTKLKTKTTSSQHIKWDEETNQCVLYTVYADGFATAWPITATQAAKWEAKNRF
jgi:hypothetical protein